MTTSDKRVVVGVDGSQGGSAALAWAADHARAVGASLDLVHVYDPETDALYGGLYPSTDAARTLHARESRVLTEADAGLDPAVPRELHLLRGGAGRALVEHSREAALLVVGGTASRAVVRALLGSTAEHCVRHAHCPVVVVPARAEAHERRPHRASSGRGHA